MTTTTNAEAVSGATAADQIGEESRLKHLLMRLNGYADGAIQPFLTDKLLERMLAAIGSTDGDLRDRLIYAALVRWVDHGMMSPAQMEQLLAVSVDERHLFYRIGEEEEGDAIFTRTFSALAACLVLDKDRERPALPAELIGTAIACAPQYLCREQDIRGYVPDKGWAHGIAHGADLAAAAIRHPYYTTVRQADFLLALEACLLDKSGVYRDDEEERLLGMIDALLEQGLEEVALQEWVQRIDGLLRAKAEEGRTLAYHHALTRTRHFMQAMYFRLIFLDRGLGVRHTLEDVLRGWYLNA